MRKESKKLSEEISKNMPKPELPGLSPTLF